MPSVTNPLQPIITTDATTATLIALTRRSDVLDYVHVFNFGVVASSGSDRAVFNIRCAFKVLGGVVSLIGTPSLIFTKADAGAATWSATADVSANTIRVRVTGAAATTVTWVLQDLDAANASFVRG